MEIIVTRDRVVEWRGKQYACALGAGGVSSDKQEGDDITPAGCYPLRLVLFRPDRMVAPETALPVAPLRPGDGWCDDPAHAGYNSQVSLPLAAHCEALWRDDEVYDLIVVIGFNDDPVVPGAGSAIFMHVARTRYEPTRGCVALARPDLLEILRTCTAETQIRIG